MIKTTATITNLLSSLQIRLLMTVDSKYPLDIRFEAQGTQMDILSSTTGYIKDNILHSYSGIKNAEIILPYERSVNTIVGNISFCNNGSTENNNIAIKIPSLEQALEKQPEIKTVKSIVQNGSIKIFYKSEWKISSSCLDDVSIDIVSNGKTPIFVAFGDMKQQRSSSDIVFPIYCSTSKLTIPKEIIWQKHKEYEGDLLCCWELVKIDHKNINNILYKVPISNNISVSNIPNRKQVSLKDFRTPTGKDFDESLWEISEESYLPVYKNGK